MAPGSAPVFSPCGIEGGNPLGCPVGDRNGTDCPGGGYGFGMDAIDINFPGVVTTEWRAGEVVEAAWGIMANHGGGYSYRLCKMPPGGRADLTEECFQQNPLEFVGDTQWAQYGEDANNRTAIKAVRTTNGTTPRGSMWTRDPIPACNAHDGGFFSSPFRNCAMGLQFERPAPQLFGYGESFIDYTPWPWSIVDLLQVPADLEAGEYTLSFRWDCEQTSQIWSTCSSINIVH